MTDTDEITALRAEVKRLQAENFSLAAWQCEFTDGKTGLVAHEHGGTYCAMAIENERLRAALSADKQTLRLHLGEMTAQEMRTLKAGFAWVLSRAAQPAPGKEKA